MKPAWDKLGDQFTDSKTVLIGDVDCTTDGGKKLCSANGVKGYPTIKYGDPDSLEDYKGGRDYDALMAFASESLGPTCGPANMDLCDEKQAAEINAVLALSVEDIEAKIAAHQKTIDDAEAHFKSELEILQKTYEGLNKAKEATISSVGPELGLLKKAKAAK